MIKVGFSEVNITPELGLPLAGMLRPPQASGVKWPLFGRTVVFDDGDQVAAVMALDILLLPSPIATEIRQAVTKGTVLDSNDLMITCSHTHRAPYTASLMDEDINFAYIDFLRDRLVRGMAEALAARRPARLKVGHIDASGWTFNRRPMYRGEEVGTHGPMWGSDFIRNEGPEDNELKILFAEDMEGRIMGGLVNFASHPTVMGAEPVYSADYPGALTEELHARYGGTFAFLQGAAGNLSPYDRSYVGPVREIGPEHTLKMGQALADKAAKAWKEGRYLEEVRVQEAHRVLAIPQRKPTRGQVGLAKWYLEKAPEDIDQRKFTRRIYGHDYTFYENSATVQEWFARETIGMWEWQRRVGTRELVEDVELQVIAIGDVAFAGFPAEYFTEFGLEVKEASQFTETFVVELANGWHGYVPTREAFAHGGYETRFAYQSRLIPEAGYLMRDAMLELLAALRPHD